MKKQLRKQQFKSLLLAVLAFVPFTTSAQVEINETNFPDENFRNYLLEQDYGKDGVISANEIGNITYLGIESLNISSLKGIENFVALKYLYCDQNQLTSLDVSRNPALIQLLCSENQLTTLDISGCTALENLSCYHNQLTSLDVSQNPYLKQLACWNNQLTSLNVSNCTALVELWCPDNQLSLLDVSTCTALANLNCGNNPLTALDISTCSALMTLYCDGNQLEVLDVSKNTALTFLSCYNNQLTTLDVSKNSELSTLNCPSNNLSTLDISKNTALTYLGCGYNQLTTLDVSNNPLLTQLYCPRNMIKGSSMDALIDGLPQNTSSEEYFIDVYNDVTVSPNYTEGNVCTKDQVAAAKAKGWTARYWDGTDWAPYEGSDESTGIMLPSMEIDNGNAPIYDLSGKRVDSLQGKKGIYIIGGKKVVVK